jgi:hypothetical protein
MLAGTKPNYFSYIGRMIMKAQQDAQDMPGEGEETNGAMEQPQG